MIDLNVKKARSGQKFDDYSVTICLHRYRLIYSSIPVALLKESELLGKLYDGIAESRCALYSKDMANILHPKRGNDV